MRKIKLARNTIASLLFQVTTIVCGFILPRLIILQFGSETNGLVNSITQFLGIIGFLELGVGAVVQSALYKPLAENDDKKTSQILVSAQRFFSKLGRILLVYVLVLMVLYPLIAKQSFGWFYTAVLIAAMSISSFAQYYFGIVDRLLLTADQKGYIQYNSQTITLVLNTIACIALIKIGASIHVVKLTTSLIFLLRPVFLRRYINKNYVVDRMIHFEGEPIKQKWNGVAQHVSAVVLDSTDSIVLTTFSTLSDVSIYSVYHLVVYGVKQILISMTTGIQSLLGELWAKEEIDELRSTFGWTEWAIHTGTTFTFGCTYVLILPFIQIYTKGVTDANYYQPLFAMLITLAHAGHCLRLPYNTMILACGHYKQTQRCYIIAAVLNVIISILTVKLFGLIGVAIGTLVAMLYQTVWMAWYNSKELIEWPFLNFLKQIAVDCFIVVIASMIAEAFINDVNGYIEWFYLAIKVVLIWTIVVVVANSVFYRERMKKIMYVIKFKTARR